MLLAFLLALTGLPQERPPGTGRPGGIRARGATRADRWIEDAKARLSQGSPRAAEIAAALDDLRAEVRAAVEEGLRPLGARPEPPKARAKPGLLGIAGRHESLYAPRFQERDPARTKDPADAAVAAALDWLERHQDTDGRWDADNFRKHCSGACPGPGKHFADVGITALSLLALTADGNTPWTGPRRTTVAGAARWLLSRQGIDGVFRIYDDLAVHSDTLYSHAMATLALAEAYATTQSQELRLPLEKAVAVILEARNPEKGWRYTLAPDGTSDTSITGWMLMALHAAELGGLAVDRKAYAGAVSWFDEVTLVEDGLCGYQATNETPARLSVEHRKRFPGEKSEALTALALFCRFLAGQSPEKQPVMRLHADRIRKCPPLWEVGPEECLVDEYYWFFASQAMRQMGGEDAKEWDGALRAALLRHQRMDGHERGSWEPVGVWCGEGGRVYMTAMCALALEAPRRLAPIPRKP